MKNIRINFPDYVVGITAVLESAGFPAYAVGGCIRDCILGREPADWDITTAATPEQMRSVFKHSPNIAIAGEPGIRHGTLIVKAFGGTCEVTTFRTDGTYTDHRRPDSVSFSSNISDDLARRDFTMNAIAARLVNDRIEFCDPFGGMDDIDHEVIKTVGNPYNRFSEDALRILRMLRFAAELGFDVDPVTADAANELSDGLNFVSAERITGEIWRTLCGKYANTAVCRFKSIVRAAIRSDISDRFFTFFDKTDSPAVRLALISEHGSASVPSGLRLPSRVRNVINMLHSIKVPPRSVPEVCALVSDFGSDVSCASDYLRILRIEGVFTGDFLSGQDLIKVIKDAVEIGIPMSVDSLEVNGNDLMEIGISPKALGRVKRILLSAVQDGKCENRREDLLLYAEKELSEE